ncbi:hypothetical protein BH18ACI3_BH18ACI3_06800 [soil metagenome]
MKTIVYYIIIMLFISLNTVGAQTAIDNPKPKTEEGREVFAVITKWADAVRSRDMKALDSLFEEGLIITTADGKTRGKKEELELLKPNPEIRTVSIRNEDVKVRVFGEAAVATGLNKMQLVNAGKDVNLAFRYTAVFVKKEGRWQLAALHTARMQPQ